VSSDDNQKLPYQANDSPPAWWRAAIDAMPWTTTEADGMLLWYQKDGACPRCKDEYGIRVSLEAEGWVGLGPEEDTDVYVSCRCNGDHPQRPDGVLEGCGWGGYVAGPVPEGGR
jgi:hypothetical protein